MKLLLVTLVLCVATLRSTQAAGGRDLAMAFYGPNKLAVAVTRGDGHIEVRLRTGLGKQWGDWIDTKRGAGGPLTLVSPAPDQVVLCVRGTNGKLYVNWLKDGAFGGWVSLGGYLHPTYAEIGAMSRRENRVELFVIANNRAVYLKIWDGSQWRGYFGLGEVVTSGVIALPLGGTEASIFFRGTDGKMYGRYSGAMAAGFSRRQLIAGSNSMPVKECSAVSWGAGRMDMVCRNEDNALVRVYYQNGWQPWVNFHGSFNSAPVVVSQGDHKLEIFAKNHDNVVTGMSYNNYWSSWLYLSETGAGVPKAVATTDEIVLGYITDGATKIISADAVWKDV